MEPKPKKNKILLLNLPPAVTFTNYERGTIFPSTAIMLLGTVLHRSGYEVTIIDGSYHRNYLERVRSYLVDNHESLIYVGMSVMTTQVPMSLEAAKKIKEFDRNIKIVWGGPHATLFPEDTLRDAHLDIVAINEGASTAVKLAQCLARDEDLCNISGIGYKNAADTIIINSLRVFDNFEELPHFDFSLLTVANYLGPESAQVYKREFPFFPESIKILPILTGLGCPYKCQFCINVILKRKYRFRPASSIVAEIKHLQKEYGTNTFIFLDEDFFISKKRTLEFLDLVEQENLHFNWRMWCRVDHFRKDYLNREMIQRLADVGHGSMVMGAESGNQEILDWLQKGITTRQIMDSMTLLSSHRKIFSRYSFIVGLENENLEQIKNTYRFALTMKTINPRVDIEINTFRLFPGSPIYDRLVMKYRIKIPDNLESWATYLEQTETFTEIPWTPPYFQQNSELLNFFANYALRSLSGSKATRKSIIKLLLSKLSCLRMRCFYFGFPFEYKALKLYRQGMKSV